MLWVLALRSLEDGSTFGDEFQRVSTLRQSVVWMLVRQAHKNEYKLNRIACKDQMIKTRKKHRNKTVEGAQSRRKQIQLLMRPRSTLRACLQAHTPY